MSRGRGVLEAATCLVEAVAHHAVVLVVGPDPTRPRGVARLVARGVRSEEWQLEAE